MYQCAKLKKKSTSLMEGVKQKKRRGMLYGKQEDQHKETGGIRSKQEMNV